MIERILLNKLYDSNKALTDKAIQSRLSQLDQPKKSLAIRWITQCRPMTECTSRLAPSKATTRKETCKMP